jgi:hypothetical protein
VRGTIWRRMLAATVPMVAELPQLHKKDCQHKTTNNHTHLDSALVAVKDRRARHHLM